MLKVSQLKVTHLLQVQGSGFKVSWLPSQYSSQGTQEGGRWGGDMQRAVGQGRGGMGIE